MVADIPLVEELMIDTKKTGWRGTSGRVLLWSIGLKHGKSSQGSLCFSLTEMQLQILRRILDKDLHAFKAWSPQFDETGTESEEVLQYGTRRLVCTSPS